MIAPMLAVPMAKAEIRDWKDWVAEEKYDGYRLIVQVDSPSVKAWTRPRKHAGSDGKTMLPRELPPHLVTALSRLPSGVYDGELMGGETSTDVSRLDLQASLSFVMFDVLRVGDTDATGHTYDQRRAVLEQMHRVGGSAHVALAQSVTLASADDLAAFVKRIWAQGGEGAIVKRRTACYQPGKRSKDFIKIKKLGTTVCTVVGFEPSRGEVVDRGPCATVVLEDARGCRTSVKTKNDEELEALTLEWHRSGLSESGNINKDHPALGRKLRIEYQDWTPKGGYRHPRWDRWEDE